MLHMARVVSPRARHGSRSGSSQGVLVYAAAAVCCLFLVYLLRTPSSRESVATGSKASHKQTKSWSFDSSTDQQRQEKAYAAWLATFKAADAAYQAYCTQVLTNSMRFKDKGGQANQDIFLFQNLFKHWPMQGRKGFYVEAGANDPLYLSTSLFFDKCLGWAGLCVEPNEEFHKALKEKRSCILVPECISAKKEVLTLVPTKSAATAHVAGNNATGTKVNCAPMRDLLQRYAGSAQQQVDMWILDVEGYEMKILEATQFSKISIDAGMVEDLLMLPKPDVLDILMAQQGYLKYQELALDSVFIRRGHPAAVDTTPIWYPPGFRGEVARKQEFVRSNLCAYLKPYLGPAWG